MNKSDKDHPHRKAQKAAIRAKNKIRFRELLDRLKVEMGGKCACSWEPCDLTVTLQFAHLDPATKLFDVADSSNAQIAQWRVEAEAAKCRLLCRAHHNEETGKQHLSGQVRGNKGRRIPLEPLTGITKPCSFCREVKDLRDFSPNRSKKVGAHGRQTACRDCLREYTAARNQENMEYIKSKRTKCVVCGKEGLDFDHVRGEKKYNVSKMSSYSRKKIDEEIAKCEVVCAEHHAERTRERKRLRAGV